VVALIVPFVWLTSAALVYRFEHDGNVVPTFYDGLWWSAVTKATGSSCWPMTAADANRWAVRGGSMLAHWCFPSGMLGTDDGEPRDSILVRAGHLATLPSFRHRGRTEQRRSAQVHEGTQWQTSGSMGRSRSSPARAAASADATRSS
jgi:hypothetical protein